MVLIAVKIYGLIKIMKKRKKLKALIISDSHGLHKEWEKNFPIPKVDMIIHGGDLTNIGTIQGMNDFMFWFKNLPIKYKIMIAGNHDKGLDNWNRYTLLGMINGIDNLYYLEDSGIEIEGINFWGSPMTPPFYNWAFMRDSEQIVKHWALIPDNTDVLITHSPMHGTLDYIEYIDKHVGSVELIEAINRVKPKYHISGHIHDMYGIKKVNKTTHINASVLNDEYQVVRAGHIIEL